MRCFHLRNDLGEIFFREMKNPARHCADAGELLT